VGVDITQYVNGMVTTGYTIALKDLQTDGDVYKLRAESNGAYNRSESFDIPATGTLQTYTFTRGSGTVDESGGSFDENNITALVLVVDSTGEFSVEFDNIGFVGDFMPALGLVEDFDDFPIDNIDNITETNNFGGEVEVFEFMGGGADGGILDLGGGDHALTFGVDSTLMGGAFLDLGPHVGSQSNLSWFDALRLDVAAVNSGDIGDQLEVRLETADTAFWDDLCGYVITLNNTTLETVEIPFSSLTCGGSHSFDASQVSRITFAPHSDVGDPGVSVTIDNIEFFFSAGEVSGAGGWELYQ
jgi:hypothetical protein